jgi:hypothetical protein
LNEIVQKTTHVCIIQGKQAMNPEHEARGALTAGYAFNSLSKLQVVGYRYLEDSTLKASQRALFESQSPEMRRQMNVLNDFEVKATLMEHINAVPSDVQVGVFQFPDCAVISNVITYSHVDHFQSLLVYKLWC